MNAGQVRQAERRETLVNGHWTGPEGSEWIPVADPADLRRTVAEVPALTLTQVASGYDGAEVGARVWAGTDPLSRGAVLTRAAGLLRDRAEQIAGDLVHEMGKTTAEATVEVTKAADFFEYYGGLARHWAGYALNDARPHTVAGVRREPVGIVLAITPWNDPLLTPARKLAPSLACGNAVLLKPATETPLVSLHLARALLDAGLPPTVLSVVTGRGSEISGPLLGDPRLGAVTFTGGNDVGDAIRARIGSRNVRLQTETGGKNAAAVMADADLDQAARTVCAAAFAQAGQRCTATSRVVVERPVADEFRARLTDLVIGLEVGPGDARGTTVGPVVSKHHQSAVLSAIAQAVDDGCAIVAGSAVAPGGELQYGAFVQPTLLTGARRDQSIWRDEVFGPAVCLVEADDFDAVVDAVNDSRFGLSASLFTQDLHHAHAFVDRVDVGQVAINLPTSGWDVHQPFGGFRESGSAFKEQGLEALSFHARAKTYAISYDR